MSNDTPLIHTAHYQLTEADLLTAFRYQSWGDPVARGRFLRRWGLCLVGMILLAAVIWKVLGENAGISIAIPLVMITLCWPLILVSQPRGTVRQLRNMPGIFDPSSIIVTPEALLVSAAGTEARREWHAVRDIVATGQHTIFLFGAANLLVVPWRSFAAPSEAQRFTELARQYWLTARSAPSDWQEPSEAIAAALGPERIEVRYQLEEADVAAYFRQHLRRLIPTFLALAVGGVLFARVTNGGWSESVIGALVCLAVVPWLVLWLSMRQARATPGVLGNQHLYFSPRGVWVVTPGFGQGRIEWSAITALEGLPRFILLRRGPSHAIIVPRRAFASGAEADQFLAQITRWYLPHAPTPAPKRRGR